MKKSSVRLIFFGHFLNDSSTVMQCKLSNNDIIHCAISEIKREAITSTLLEELRPIERRGFDRLVESGIEEEEIRMMREQFRENILMQRQFNTEELRDMEERWIGKKKKKVYSI